MNIKLINGVRIALSPRNFKSIGGIGRGISFRTQVNLSNKRKTQIIFIFTSPC